MVSRPFAPCTAADGGGPRPPPCPKCKKSPCICDNDDNTGVVSKE